MKGLDNEEILRRTEALAGPILEDLGLEMIAAEFVTDRGRRILRVYIDRLEASAAGPDEAGPGGVTLGEIEEVSRELGAALDAEDFIRTAYDLEVSSPGLNRPLRLKRHFDRCVGEKVRVRSRAAIEGRRNFIGVLERTGDDGVTVLVEGRPYRIGFDEIEKANLEFDYSKL